ncbi:MULTISPECIES: SDR family oxidoreductase [Sphingobacterium]|uniref:SDR family oxidoreductase n=1 Tax=Sphingobacterium litopenaei TaxID=2763500 RepID=A0ABR7YGV8_9SPHI|nr:MULTISPECIES: SDR family oxidoreductase [Sphingobacterium]MBD1430474.1 SDR family oxidoreductase [Sphingobacterium litopenaei]NGM73546.1 SDR family oxidoreductase [Sphingobacterium sp. SGL-16]
MKINLIGKKALVGGSTSGIGKAIAQQLAACGASVTLVARNEDKLQAVLASLDIAKSQSHQYIVTDYLDFEEYKATISEYFTSNSVDILVNNTQGPSPGTVTQKSEEDYLQAFNLLFQNAVLTTNLALEKMKENSFGRVINVSSMTVKEPQDTLVLSNTMRTALVSWSKSLSNSVAKDNITVNSVMTGYFETERLTSLMENQAKNEEVSFDEIRTKRIQSVPVQRLGDPKEYGYLVAFLASEYASYLSGASIPLDGGIAKTIF